MSVYRVEITNPGCSDCGHGIQYDVIGPDEVAHSTSYGDEEDAHSTARGFDHAYELGHQAGIREAQNNPWTAFTAETLPPLDNALLVWDAEFDNISSTYWMNNNGLETAQAYKWSHWMLASALAGPPGAKKQVQLPVVEPAPTAPTNEDITDESLRTVHGKTYDESAAFDDDIPF